MVSIGNNLSSIDRTGHELTDHFYRVLLTKNGLTK